MYGSSRGKFFDLINKKNKNSMVLSWFMGFFDEVVAEKLIGKKNMPNDCFPVKDWNHGASERKDWDKKINYARSIGNFAVGVGWGTCIAFGHGGPGEFRERLIQKGENYRITEHETGVKKEVRYFPHYYRYFDYPVKNIENFELKLTDPQNLERYKDISEETAFYKKNNFITYANVNGFFSGIHYFLYPYEELLEDMLLNMDFIKELVNALGEFNLKAAEELLKRGIDIICFCDDLGSKDSLLISPDMYRDLFLPWHKKLAELCHKYNAYLHMHSHGNINSIMDDLYSAGIDMLNPNDPNEGMDIVELKNRYGDKITFVGGIDKFFFEWYYNKQEEYIINLIKNTGGGFILMDSGGVPENVTNERFKMIRDLFEYVKNIGGKR